MITECKIYDDTDILKLSNECDNYLGRLFTIKTLNLDGDKGRAFYIGMLVKYQGVTGFLVLFDDRKDEYLNKFKFIDICFITEYTLFTVYNNEHNSKWYEYFSPYINENLFIDFISRIDENANEIKILINNKKNILKVTHSFDVEIN